MRKSIVGLFVCGLAWCSHGRLLTFTPDAVNGTSNGQYRWDFACNWRDENNEPAAPTHGDDLYVGVTINNFHAVNLLNVSLNSARFARDIKYSGISWGGFTFREGADGLIMEGGNTGSVMAYSSLALLGNVIVDIKNVLRFENEVRGHAGSKTYARIIKKGFATFGFGTAGDYFAGATICAGGLQMNDVNGKSGIDFLFDCPDVSYDDNGGTVIARLILPSDLTLVDGGIGSVRDKTLATHRIVSTDSNAARTLTICGTPKSADQWFAGELCAPVSFVFAPSVAGQSFTFAKATSSTAGSLTVSNGTITVADGGSFPSVQNIVIQKDGVFGLAADAGEVTCRSLQLMDTSGRVQVAEGQTLRALRVRRDGAYLDPGDYTSSSCDWVTGAGTVRVTTEMLYTADPIVFDVPADTTWTLAEAIEAYNAANPEATVTLESINGGADKARPLVKRGLGQLTLDTAISSFAGTVFIEAGKVHNTVRYGLGKEGGSHVYVLRGATLSGNSQESTLNDNRTFHISGAGAAGEAGALVCGNAPNGVYDHQKVFGKTIILDEDATCKLGNWVCLGYAPVQLNGNTLTVVGGGEDNVIYIRSIADNGKLNVQNGELREARFSTSGPDNKVTFSNKGGWRFFAGSSVLANWPFCFKDSGRARFYTDAGTYTRDSTINCVKCPYVETDAMLDLRYQGDRVRGSAKFYSPIRGAGGFATLDNRTVFLHLLNSENTFTGGFDFTRGTIWVYPNGSLPNGPDAGAVKLHPTAGPYNVTGHSDNNKNFRNTFDGVAFMEPVRYDLPDLVISGTYPSRVQNGRGAWRTVTLNGAGGAEWYSGTGAALLDVKKGTLKLPRGAAPGLWEGTNVFETAAAADADLNAGTTVTNLAVRGPTCVCPREDYNYTTRVSCEHVMYSGWVWNRSETDVTWTFATANAGVTRLFIDGEEVLTGVANEPTAANVTLTPGPHAFRYHLRGGAIGATESWPGSFGFVYDRAGRNDVSNPGNFECCLDTGDGALFTRVREAQEDLPVFNEMKFAKGTGLELNGQDYKAAKITGWPQVTSAVAGASLTVTNALCVDCADLANGPLVSAVPLALAGAGVRLELRDSAAAHRGGRHVIATAPSIALPARLAVSTDIPKDDPYWAAEVLTNGDGTQSLAVTYSAGTLFILR